MTQEPFEPIAQEYLNAIGRGEAPQSATCEEAYALSAAVSLKRIADALWGDEKTTGILLLLNHIEANGRAK